MSRAFPHSSLLVYILTVHGCHYLLLLLKLHFSSLCQESLQHYTKVKVASA